MIRKRILFAIVVINSLVGCSESDDGPAENIVLNHYKSECYSPFPHLCPLRQAGSTDDWQLTHIPHVGLDYQWGYIHEFDARYQATDSPPADAPPGRYNVLGAVRKTPVAPGTVFDIWITEPDGIRVLEPGKTYEVYGQKAISCTPDQCQSIASLLEQQQSMLFEFMHHEQPTQPLILTQIKCAASREAFRQSCLPQ